MTVSNSITPQQATPQLRNRFWLFMESLPGVKFLKNLKIGHKLTIGFGILVTLTLLGAVFSYLGSSQATTQINNTGDVRVPAALTSARAQANLLQIISDVRGYLALGDPELRNNYNQSRQAFETELVELERLSANLGPDNQRRLGELKAAYGQWLELPELLFELRNDQLAREPAYRILALDGLRLGGSILIDVQQMIEAQAEQPPTDDNINLLTDLAKFQGSFASMISGLRGYVTTLNRDFRVEYRGSLTANNIAWERLMQQRDSLTPDQRAVLDRVAANREAFLKLPDEMFKILTGDRYREDLYLFRTQAVPLTDKMQDLLKELTTNQQDRLDQELDTGREGLARANAQTLTGGIIALIVGVLLALIFRENIAGPVSRLTDVAEQIRAGQLGAQAQVESADEIGTLAATFNNMTNQLRQTLFQVRKEKKRADDLLNVVIPIGVELSSEKDFNRLLENMLLEAKKFCHADAGIVYLKDEDRLKFVIVRNDTLNIAMGGTVDKDVTFSRLPMLLPVYDDQTTPGAKHQSIAAYAALTGAAINTPDAYQPEVLSMYGPGIFDEKTDYRSVSYLTIPLKNTQGQVLGVLQLINAQDPETNQVIPFDPNLQQMMESFSSLAVAALEAYIREQSLKQEIQQLRIEIDEAKRQKQVSEIVDTDFFQDLQAKARSIRSRRSSPARSENTPGDESNK